MRVRACVRLTPHPLPLTLTLVLSAILTLTLGAMQEVTDVSLTAIYRPRVTEWTVEKNQAFLTTARHDHTQMLHYLHTVNWTRQIASRMNLKALMKGKGKAFRKQACQIVKKNVSEACQTCGESLANRF